MHIVNHVAVGAGIALIVKQPVLALPIALVSHFGLDAIPHYGVQGDEGYAELFRRRRSYLMVTIDFIGVLLLILLCIGQAWYVYGAMVMAILPDLVWPYRYFRHEKFGRKPRAGTITKFHQAIQWCERPWGIFIEIPLAVILIALISEAI